MGEVTSEEVNRVSREVIEKVITHNQVYKHLEVGGWCDKIINQTIQALVGAANIGGQVYKFIVDCTIVQKSDAGLSTEAGCYWNELADKAFAIRWDNKHLVVILHVYALPI